MTIEPSAINGLPEQSWAMVDKMGAVRREKIGKTFGALTAEDTSRLDAALMVFLGLAGYRFRLRYQNRQHMLTAATNNPNASPIQMPNPFMWKGKARISPTGAPASQ
jgi:hypothetical protein